MRLRNHDFEQPAARVTESDGEGVLEGLVHVETCSTWQSMRMSRQMPRDVDLSVAPDPHFVARECGG